MTHVLQPFLGKFPMIYCDDILAYNESIGEHIDHLRQFL